MENPRSEALCNSLLAGPFGSGATGAPSTKPTPRDSTSPTARLQGATPWNLRGERGILWVVGELPGGSVTFLFTDIEGSTKLLHELGAKAYDEALVEHRRLLRQAFSRHGGVEVDNQGDAFFYASSTPSR